ncbi:MAG: DNA gyrase subunit A [Ruminococcaceae bacterium]|nr:DNA gyrase subunit A [Oscillospiraceae bacterium]
MNVFTEGQNIRDIEIDKEVKTSFIDYSMSVIVDRALPDVRDGLKPVHRRILYSMFNDSLTYDKPYRKSATTVGNVLGHYHPHGDAAVYDTMVRMAQPFSLRYPLIDGQGNFGNVDGDGAAAYRYTEARMAKIANEMLVDIDKEVVNFMPNFDNKLKEPTVLPARFPNLLVNGSIGIAVGMATNIPSHNMREVVDGTIFLMEHPDAEIADIMQYIKGPDFPTAGTIYGTAGIAQAYMTGKGHILVRAKTHFEENKNRTSIVVTEIPYQVNKAMLVMSIADLVKDKRIEGIADLRDESSLKTGMRIVIDLKRDANPQIILNLLYKYTRMQDTFAINMLALVDNEPKTLNLKQMLTHYINHQTDVIRRRTEYELKKAKARMHIYEGYKIAVDNIDEVIRIIRASKDIPESRLNLINRFGFSEAQAQAIVELPLGRLSGMEIENILAELERLAKLVEKLEGILADDGKIHDIIKEDLQEISRKYGDERRTAIEVAADDILIEDLIEKHKCVVTVSNTGYIKRQPVDAYQSQNRGGKGITAMGTKEEDYVTNLIVSHSHNYLFMFSNFGKLYVKKCYEIPEASRTAKGTNLVNILQLDTGEKITAFVSGDKLNSDAYLTMVTKLGVIKRTSISRFKSIRKGGIIAISLDEGDELLYVSKTDGNCDIMIATNEGACVRFKEEYIRETGRTSRGVRAINLSAGGVVVGTTIITPEEAELGSKKLLTVTENGFGKRSEISEFAVHNRGGKGMICHKITEKTGKLAGIAGVEETDDIMLITDSGIIIRTSVSQISTVGRNASGVIVMRTGEEARIVSFSRIVNDGEIDKEAENATEDNTVLTETDGEDVPETDVEDTAETEETPVEE